MTEKMQRWDRRREHRSSTVGRITWRKQGDLDQRQGWLSDTSWSSMSFISPAHTQPEFGELIEWLSPPGESLRFRVTRTAVYGDNLALIGCCQTSARTLTN